MISTTELRLGNWVLDWQGNKAKVTAINSECILVNISYRENHFSEISPIVLTPEILEKCGFKISGTWGVLTTLSISHDKMGLASIEWYNKDTAYLDFEGTSASANIKHLHQLQNLYFALTGEELAVNL